MWKALRLAHFLGRGGEKNRTPLIHRPRQLRMLAKSRDAGIRFSVARSSCLTVEILQLLVRDKESWPVRMAVAWHPLLTPDMLELLLADEEKPVREAAMKAGLFEKMYGSKYPNKLLMPTDSRIIVGRWTQNEEVLKKLLASSFFLVRAIAGLRVCSYAALVKLSESDDGCVRSAAAGNPRLPRYIMWRLVHDRDEAVCASLASNPLVIRSILEILARDPRSYVRDRAKRRLESVL
jgi:HEAT repeat protein